MYRQSLMNRYRDAGQDLAALVRSIPPAERQVDLQGYDGERAENCLERPLNALFQKKAGSMEQVIERVYAEEFQVNFPQIRSILHSQPDLPQLGEKIQAGENQDDSLEARLDEILWMRREVSACLENLPDLAWSLASRSPSTGVRTLQWWVERSLGAIEAALQRLKTGIKVRA